MKLSTRLLVPLGTCAALALAGCSNADDATSEDQSGSAEASTTSDGTGGLCDVTVLEDAQSLDTSEENLAESELALSEVGVSDDVAAAPTLTYEAPLAITAESVLITNEGDGDTISEDQIITFNYMVCDTVTGEKMYSTWGETADEDIPATFVLSAGNFGDVLVDSLEGAKVGTRLLWGQPGYSAEESYTGAASNGYLYVLNVTDARDVPEEASGTEVTPSDDTLPTVEFKDGSPTITVPSTFTDPTELIVEPLIEGDGAVVEAGQTIAVKYSGWLTDGTLFDSAWDENADSEPVVFGIGSGQVIDGWDEGLVGQKVGSRVLLVIPSDMGYGETGSGTIPGDSTLVFVVDILDAF